MRIIVVIISLLTAACSASMQSGASRDAVTLGAAPVRDSILLTLRNGSKETVSHNLCTATVERSENGAWQNLPTGRVCTMMMALLPPGGHATFTTTLPDGAPSGDYRFVVSVATPQNDGMHRVTSNTVHVAASTPDSSTESDPVSVIRRYYSALDARDYRGAYQLWGNEGEGSGQSYEQFAAGFADTKHVTVEAGAPGQIGAAAGSRYIDVPVVVRAELQNGSTQKFEGTYTLRRSVVDGATPAQRRWHIYSAHITRSR